MLGSAGRRFRRATIAAITAALAFALPSTAVAAGPTAIAADSDGTVYAGFASGAVSRFRASDGVGFAHWSTQVADANGSLGAVVSIDVEPSDSNPNGGDVWVLDANRRVQEFTRGGAFIRGFRVEPCEGSNDPNPGRKGGLAVTADSVYVAHPCRNRVYRYSKTSLVQEAATDVTAPHGIAAPIANDNADTQFLYVAQPQQATIRRLDLNTLGLPVQNQVPINHSGTSRPEDVFLGTAGRIYVSESEDTGSPAFSHQLYAVDADGSFGFTEAFNFSGAGRPTVTHPFDDPVAFELFATSAPVPTSVIVVDRGNSRIQRVTAETADNGNLVWEVDAADPGPPPAPTAGGTGGTGGSGGSGGVAGAGGGSAGAAGAPAVSINDGARYATTPDVTLTIREPAGTKSVEIANDSEFAGIQARSLSPNLSYDWTLATDGSDRVERRVYVRFPGSAEGGVVSDEITLDRRAPLVGSPTIRKKRRPDRKGRRWVLRVPADDEVSGLDKLAYGPEKNGEFESRAFKSPLRVERRRDARFVRVSDVAGNLSDSKRVKRAKRA